MAIVLFHKDPHMVWTSGRALRHHVRARSLMRLVSSLIWL